MTDKEVIDNFHTAWKALAHLYDEYPDEETRRALNLLKKNQRRKIKRRAKRKTDFFRRMD